MGPHSHRRWQIAPGGHRGLRGNNIRYRVFLCAAPVLHERMAQPRPRSIGLVHLTGSCKQLLHA
jgi:hypothetical protein